VALMPLLPNTVVFDDGRMLTRNLAPGQRVYDEELHTVQGAEHRTWNPTKSKIGSYLVKGGRNLELREDSVVLYLGAANGTTPSHVSDIIAKGLMVAVEFSPRSFRDLLRVADRRPNMVPVLADAWRPELYERYLGKIDLLFQDISQRQQAAIFSKNILRFKPKLAMIAVKARSVNVAANPRDVYQEVAEQVADATGYDVIEVVDLGPFEKDHAAIVLVPGDGKPKAPRAERREEGQERPREGGYEKRGAREGSYDRRGPPREGGFRGPPREGGGGGGWQQRGPPRGGGGGGGGWQERGPPRRSDRPQTDRPQTDRPRDERPPPRDERPRDDRPDRRKWK